MISPTQRKMTHEIRYDNKSFRFVRQNHGLNMYISTDSKYCVITDKKDEVIFEMGIYEPIPYNENITIMDCTHD